MRYAEIAVNVPLRPGKVDDRTSYPLRLTFHYSIPEGMEVQVGQLVWVPFGVRFCQGIVVALSDRSPVQETKDIISTIDPQPVLTGYQVELARWISQYYLCPLLEALRVMLPSGIEQRVTTTIVPVAAGDEAKETGLTPGQKSVLDLVRSRNGLEMEELRRGLKAKNVGAIVSQLMRRGLVIKLLEMERPRVRPKFVPTAWLAVGVEEAQQEVARLTEPARRRARVLQALLEAGGTLGLTDLCAATSCPRETVRAMVKKAILKMDEAGQPVSLALGREQVEQLIRDAEWGPKGGQARALAALIAQAGPLELAELHKIAGASRATIQALARKGLVGLGEREAWRTPGTRLSLLKKIPPIFTPRQEQAWQEIQKELAAGSRAVLLHGVTGSGKTEIYIRALGEVIAQGRQGIVMVPEIALTPQTIQRFVSRFPGRVAVLHSRLSPGEQFDEWRRARDGLVDVVIGPRSAVFAPLPRLGLIVIDDEHEWTYKQQEHSPRYHARDVALKLAELTGALVILGSATPDIATYQRAKEGEFKLLELPERIKVAGREAGERLPTAAPEVTSSLPPIEIVDLREELRAGNRSIFSRSLRRALEVALAAGQQVILFLNRRGTATFILCRDCGYVVRCRRCAVPLAYHQMEDDLVCHQCNYRTLVMDQCPKCWSRRIRYFGLGTQKVEEEVRKAYPQARVLRWDWDVTRGKDAHERILDRFLRHQADILIGTQMIAKGLDLPLVTLVGVISADTALHLPDFRTGERTYQLLTQVAGRAGRSVLGGKVIIQTYNPEHYAVQAARDQDYGGFFRKELAYRGEHGYPPRNQLARLVYAHPVEEKGRAESERLSRALRQRIAQLGLANCQVLGPAPAYVSRLRGRYRWQLVVRAEDVHPLLSETPIPPGWAIDVDPMSLL